jgi:hypothetical protein
MNNIRTEQDVAINGYLDVQDYITTGSTLVTTTISQVGTAVVGSLGDFVSGMQGGVIRYADGTTAFITNYISQFVVTAQPSQNKTSQSATISYGGTEINENGMSSGNINTTNLTTINLNSTNINASNNIVAGNNITSNSINSATLSTTGDITAGGNLVVGGALVVDNISVVGNIVAGGDIQGTNLDATNNVVAANTVQGNIVNSVTDIVAGGDVQSTNVLTNNVIANNVQSTTATFTNVNITGDAVVNGTVQTNNLDVLNTLSANQLSAGAGGVTSIGNISTTNGNITTTNGAMNALTMQATTINVTGNLNATGTVNISNVNTKGEIPVSNGSSVVGFGPGSNGGVIMYDSAQTTGLTSTSPTFSSTVNAMGGMTGGTLNFSLLRIGRIGICTFQVFPQMSNGGGGATTMTRNFTVNTAFTPTDDGAVYPIQIIINGATQTGLVQLGSIGAGSIQISLAPINNPLPSITPSFNPGDTVQTPVCSFVYKCSG